MVSSLSRQLLHLNLLRCCLFPTPLKTLILIALQEVWRPVVVYSHKGWERLRAVALIVMREAVAWRVLTCKRGKGEGRRVGGRGGVLGLRLEKHWLVSREKLGRHCCSSAQGHKGPLLKEDT